MQNTMYRVAVTTQEITQTLTAKEIETRHTSPTESLGKAAYTAAGIPNTHSTRKIPNQQVTTCVEQSNDNRKTWECVPQAKVDAALLEYMELLKNQVNTHQKTA